MTTETKPVPPETWVKVRVFGTTPGTYTWRVYRRRWGFWYVANWGQEDTFAEAVRVSGLELKAAIRGAA